MLPEKFSQVTASTTFGNPLSVINLHFQHLFCKLQVVECNLNPKWKPHDISVTRLCGGNEDQKILVSKILAFDWLTEVRWTSYLLTPLPQYVFKNVKPPHSCPVTIMTMMDLMTLLATLQLLYESCEKARYEYCPLIGCQRSGY